MDRNLDLKKCWDHENLRCKFNTNLKKGKLQNNNEDEIETFNISDEEIIVESVKPITKSVVIIYRWRDELNRDLGLLAAKLCEYAFNERHVKCFLDTASLTPGIDLKKKLQEEMELAKNVILLITPDCFNRCEDDNDFLWWEIEIATILNCNIIPVIAYDPEPGLPNTLIEYETRYKVINDLLNNKLRVYLDVEHLASCIEKIIKVL